MSSPYVEHSVDGLAILLWAADPDMPQRLATPFMHAAAAAALELEVEVYFSARSVHLLVPGVAERLRAAQQSGRTIRDHMLLAIGAGARFYVCSDAWEAQGLGGGPRIAECSGHGGAVQFAARAADSRWRSLVY